MIFNKREGIKMKQLKILAIVICLVAALSMTCLVSATTQATTASVHVKNNSAGSGADITQCNTGTNLWVFWTQYPASNTVVEVKIIAPNGAVVYDQTGLTTSDGTSGIVTFTASQAGTYYVIVIGANNVVLGTNRIASATVFALPESALGALTATTAAFGAFGAFALRKRKLI